jgi:hypothetical protein
MNALKPLFIVISALLMVACAHQSDGTAFSPSVALEKAVAAKTRILVTFVDDGVNRVALADFSNHYRRRGAYKVSSWSKRRSEELADQYHITYVGGWPVTALHEYCAIYEIPSGVSPDEVIKQLSQDARVVTTQKVNTFTTLTEGYSDPYFNLQVGLSSMGISAVHRWATGKDITIAVIDTGIDRQHPDLNGQVVESKDFVPTDAAGSSSNSHGTAVAGIIAALANNAQGIVGIAPNAKLIGLEACWSEKPDSSEAVCDSLSLAQALDTATQLGPQILNLSLTGPADPLLSRLVEQAIQRGIIVVAADPGIIGDSSGFPASMDQVIAVRAARPSAPPARSPVSWLAAPGTEVLTTLPNGTYDFMSGSSFAAAHVSGVIALMLQLRPDLSASQTKRILQATIRQAAPAPGIPVAGTVDACAAIAKLQGIEDCLEPAALQGKGKPKPAVLLHSTYNHLSSLLLVSLRIE